MTDITDDEVNARIMALIGQRDRAMNELVVFIASKSLLEKTNKELLGKITALEEELTKLQGELAVVSTEPPNCEVG